MGTKYWDLTPFDLKYFDHRIPYERFLRYVCMERDPLDQVKPALTLLSSGHFTSFCGTNSGQMPRGWMCLEHQVTRVSGF